VCVRVCLSVVTFSLFLSLTLSLSLSVYWAIPLTNQSLFFATRKVNAY
jgi:hypothetical protein